MRNWLGTEPDLARFPTHNERIARAYAIAAEEAHKAGFLVFGHSENTPAALRDGLDIVEHVWGFGQAGMSAEQLRAFQEGKFLTWATFMTDRNRLGGMIADAVRRGAYLNPTLHYEWGGMSRRAAARELEDYHALSNPDLVYFPATSPTVFWPGSGRSRISPHVTRICRGSPACRRTTARRSRPGSAMCWISRGAMSQRGKNSGRHGCRHRRDAWLEPAS